VNKGIAGSSLLTALALIGLSAVLYVGLELSSRWEQAKTPGGKKWGSPYSSRCSAFQCSFLLPLAFSA
jgi:hypothetical protein